MAVIESETCTRCGEEFTVLIGDGNDDIPDTSVSCKWACPGCGHEELVTWQPSASSAIDQADVRIVPDDFHEFGLVIAELCGDRPDASASEGMATA